MDVVYITFFVGNIVSFWLISQRKLSGFIIGIIAAIIGFYIFRNSNIWLIINQCFYLGINTYSLIKYYYKYKPNENKTSS